MSQRRAKFVMHEGRRLHRYRCPYCRAVLLFDDARRVTAHQAPLCQGWDRLVRSMHTVELGEELLPGGDDRRQS